MLKNKGFTLVELMIILAIIGILASIAIPNYQDSVRKGNRVQAKTEIYELSQRLQSCMSQFGSYLSSDGCSVQKDLPKDTPEHNFTITGDIQESTYTLKANAKGNQTKDKECQVLTLNNFGEKGVNKKCW